MLKDIVSVSMIFGLVSGHGYMWEPAGRGTAAMRGFSGYTTNYNHMANFCGGFAIQWSDSNGGACGVCGDSVEQATPRNHEVGGLYVSTNRSLTGTYQSGSVITVGIQLTAYHRGFFTFRLCVNNDLATEVTQACLDEGILNIAGTDSPIYDINATENTLPTETGYYEIDLQLPVDVVAEQAVLQWNYTTGNSVRGWPGFGTCLGCGPHETFINCADIAIVANGATSTSTTSTATSSPSTSSGSTNTGQSSTMSAITGSTLTTSTSTASPIITTTTAGCTYVAAGAYAGSPGMTTWCQTNCPSNCPETHCQCNSSASPTTTSATSPSTTQTSTLTSSPSTTTTSTTITQTTTLTSTSTTTPASSSTSPQTTTTTSSSTVSSTTSSSTSTISPTTTTSTSTATPTTSASSTNSPTTTFSTLTTPPTTTSTSTSTTTPLTTTTTSTSTTSPTTTPTSTTTETSVSTTTTIASSTSPTTTSSSATSATSFASSSSTTTSSCTPTCWPVSPYDTVNGMTEWCYENCLNTATPNCPASHCQCSTC